MTDYVKFVYIALCFAITLYTRLYCVSKYDWTYLAIGMFFTLISDFFLLLFDHQPAGVTAFCMVHVAYILRVRKDVHLLGFTLLAAVPLLVWADYMVAVSALYACLFIQDIVANWINYRRKGFSINRVLMLMGLLLFALCDINVLLFNLPRYTDFPPHVADTAFGLIWVFYTPAQLLLALSAVKWEIR